jgi:hypothetical protein
MLGAVGSTDYIVSNNLATDTTYYGDFGINSSGSTGAGSLNLPNATYLYSQTGDLVIGTGTANAIHFVINSGATDAFGINTSSAWMIGGSAGAQSQVFTSNGAALPPSWAGPGNLNVISAATTIPANYSYIVSGVFTVNAPLTVNGILEISGTPASPLIPQTQKLSTVTTYTLALADNGGHIYITDTAFTTVTVPANSSIAFPIGSNITIVNGQGTASISIAITTDTMILANSADVTGTRTLAVYGICTLLKVAATVWIISGNGLT